MQLPLTLLPLHIFPPAACSSSLVSLHMAFNALLLGNTSRATNSGANLMLSGGHPPSKQVAAACRVQAGEPSTPAC